MTTPEGNQLPFDDEMMWYDPNAAASTPDTDSPFDDLEVDNGSGANIPPKPDHDPSVPTPEEPTAEEPEAARNRKRMPRSKVGKVAAGLLLSGLAVSGVGALVANHGEGQVSQAASWALEHRNDNVSPEELAEHAIPTGAARTEISIGTTAEEVGGAAAIGGLALAGLVGTGRGFRAVGTWRSNRKAAKASRPEGETRAQRRQAKKLAAARALVEAADGTDADSEN